MLTLNDFSPVTLEEGTIIEDYLRRYPQEHSDNTLINMLCWNHYAHYHYAVHHGCLLIMTIIDGERTFRFPIGKQNDLVLADLFFLACQAGGEIPVQMLNKPDCKWASRIYPDIPIYEDRDFADYVYMAHDLAALPGKKYLTIRGEINAFRRSTDYRVVDIRPGDIGEIREFLEQWCEWKHCDEVPILAYERDAVFYAVDHFAQLNCRGNMIRTENGIGAIALWGALNSDTIVVHFEKALPGFPGIYKAINKSTAEAVQAQYRYINRESDMGSPGLREAKSRYHPHHMAPVWYMKRSDIVAAIQ